LSKSTYFYNGKKFTEEEMCKLIKHSKKNIETRVSKSLELTEGDNVLDIGCASGCLTYMLSHKHKKVIGIDMLSESIDIAKNFNASNNIEYIHMDGHELNVPDAYFDCILLLEVLEHVFEPMHVLKNIYTKLKPGGFLILSTPNSTSIENIVNNLTIPLQKKPFSRIENEPRNTGTQTDHIFIWDTITLFRLLNRAGFKYVTHTYASPRLPYPVSNFIGELRIFMPIMGIFNGTVIFKVQKPANGNHEKLSSYYE
jgi:ubiquinone/menaquinone biosynthesis C-methylase UbiE